MVPQMIEQKRKKHEIDHKVEDNISNGDILGDWQILEQCYDPLIFDYLIKEFYSFTF